MCSVYIICVYGLKEREIFVCGQVKRIRFVYAFRGPSSLALSRGSVYIINLLMTGRPSAPVAACAAGGHRRRAGTGASVLRMADYCAPRANDTL